MKIIGLMSGTSLDGCDVALAEINENKYELIDYLLYPYTNEFKNRIKKNLSDDTAKLSEICSLNYELPLVFKEAIDKILDKNNLKYSDIDYVASHGQTIWHNPKGLNGLVPSTLQIGNGQIISSLTGIPVISNFRVADVVVGGEGAPLVPMFEYLFFKNDLEDVVLQNLGGMGNLTYIPKNASIDDVFAFDTGPANVIIDHFMNKYYNVGYDKDGEVALSGSVILPIIEKLEKDEFILRKPPKSTGREKYSYEALEKMSEDFDFDSYEKEDIITTVTELTVRSMAYNYRSFISNIDKIIVSGGGVHNKYIMNRLREEFPGKVFALEEIGFNSDAKEAFAFAVLGYLSVTGKPGNVKASTGAKYDMVLGEITLAKKWRG